MDEPVLVQVGLFDQFVVTVGGVTVPDAAWSRRTAVALVKILALAPGRRLHREQVIDALWPETPVDVAAPRLHKAAHYARRGLGVPGALLLGHDMVTLLPHAEVVVDVLDFCAEAEQALRSGSDEQVRTALGRYGGEPLPEDRYEAFAEDIRERVSGLHVELLARLAPARSGVAAGSPARPARGGQARLVGRRAAGDVLRARIARTEQADGGTLIVSGPAGVGKSAVLQAAVSIASQRGWRIGRGVASALESPWAYAPALEAIASLCGAEAADELQADPATRDQEIRAVLRGGRLGDGEATRAWLFPAVERLLLACATRQPVLLVVDDVDEADLASVRLLHYVARRAAGHKVLLVVTHRSPAGGGCAQLRDSLLSRDLADGLALTPLPPAATGRMVAERFPTLGTDRIAEVVAASGGLPFTALQLGRFLSGDRLAVPSSRLPDAVLRSLRCATELDESFGVAQLARRAGISTADAARHLAVAEAASILEPTAAGHQFRHALLREVLASVPVSAVEAAGHPGPMSMPAEQRTVGRPVCRRHPSLMPRRHTAGAVATGHSPSGVATRDPAQLVES